LVFLLERKFFCISISKLSFPKNIKVVKNIDIFLILFCIPYYIFRVSYIICKKDPVKRFPSRSFQRGFHRGVAESIITIEGSEKSGDRVAVAG